MMMMIMTNFYNLVVAPPIKESQHTRRPCTIVARSQYQAKCQSPRCYVRHSRCSVSFPVTQFPVKTHIIRTT